MFLDIDSFRRCILEKDFFFHSNLNFKLLIYNLNLLNANLIFLIFRITKMFEI